jgi:peroxiredoxin Q/BCP
MATLLTGDLLPEVQKMTIGKKAPDFILPGSLGENWRLSENLGKVIALLFYPQNETLVCTKQLCSIRDNWADYLDTKALVIGISPGSIEKHREFAKKYRLPMPLLVDEGRKITSLYGQHSWMPLSWSRAIVIVDAKGVVRHRKVMFRAFHPTDYAVLSAIYQANTDASQERFEEILKNFRHKKKEN